ncbi:DUF922 domain-containing protein [uncultured Psychroserpens sp.]|uniref:DUF922 domain-containing protein n=1 Tax=uncultured Psychroserpens sp. TaxID=255436 RepID=UPI0026234A4F|nr:DUF922 domain-containing protein [uncultured Psychroserpens sp.]
MLLRIVLLALTCLLGSPNEAVTLTWDESKKLKWSDFKGEVETDSDATAVTASGITFSYSLKKTDGRITSFKTNVEAHFYPEKSWYIKKKGNDYILAHEQLHFDITELHVRKLRYEMAQLKVTPSIKADLDMLHSHINKALAKMQQLYDTESQNSINKEQQAKWNAFVSKELKTYEAYKSKG